MKLRSRVAHWLDPSVGCVTMTAPDDSTSFVICEDVGAWRIKTKGGFNRGGLMSEPGVLPDDVYDAVRDARDHEREHGHEGSAQMLHRLLLSMGEMEIPDGE